MKTFTISRIAVLLSALVVMGVLTASTSRPASDGKSIFLSNKCSTCHAIQAAGIARSTPATAKAPPDLSKVGARHNAAWISSFLQKEQTLNGKKHALKFKGTDQELGVLAAWLGGLK